MHVADVRDDGDIGLHHLAKIPDLPRAVHARLDHRRLMRVGEAQQRLRRADLIIIVGRGLERMELHAQYRGDHFLCCRLADAARHLHKGNRKLRTVPRGQVLERKQRVRHLDVKLSGQQRFRHAGAQTALRARGNRLFDIVMPVEALADERQENFAALNGAAVGVHAEDLRRPLALQQLAVHRRE